jgi:replication factor-a protein 1 (Rpa1)
MNDELVTHLSDKVMQHIYENPGKKTQSFVQYIDHSKREVNDRTITTVRLSDGHFSENFILFPTIAVNFLDVVKPFDIIEAGLVKKDATSAFMLVYEYKVIYSNVRETIGSPIPFNKDKLNMAGANAIPDEVIFGKGPEQNPQVAKVDEYQDFSKKKPVFKIESDDEDQDLDHFTQIANLTHYDQSFKIRGRILKKNQLKTFKTKDGRDGCVFSIVIKDESRAIQANFFNESARRFYDTIEEGKVYSFEDADIKTAGKFNPTDNKFELGVSERTRIKRLPDIKEIDNYNFKFSKISEIDRKVEGDNVDLIAIVEDPGQIKEIHLKNGELKEKRTIRVKDDTGFAIDVTLWGKEASSTVLPKDSIVAFQDFKVKVFMNTKSLGYGSLSKIITKIPEHQRHKDLLIFKNSNSEEPLKNLGDNGASITSSFTKVSQMENEVLLLEDQPENTRSFFTIIGTLVRILGNLYYESCSNEACMKKVTPNGQGMYYCEKCEKSFNKPRYRFMTTFKFADDSGNFVATVSGDETCQLVFKKSIDQLAEMKLNDERAFSEFTKTCLFEEFKVRVAAKRETYNGDSRIRYQLIRLTPTMFYPESLINSLYSKLTNQE